jgi:hypothetical protein
MKKTTKKTVLFQARQGDVLLLVAAPLDAVEPEATDPRGLVLAEGETSGHFHGVRGLGVKLFRFRDPKQLGRIVEVARGGAEVRVVGGSSGGVDRHTPIALASGQYLSTVQRSWTASDEAAASAQVND